MANFTTPPFVNAKTPTEALNYLADFSAEIAANEVGDTIASSSVTADAGLTIVSSTVNTAATGIIVRISGGAANQMYQVNVTANMASGQVMCRSFKLTVVAARG